MARGTLRTPNALAEAGLISQQNARKLGPVAARYAIAITPEIAGLIDTSDPDDPIARQFVPSTAELNRRPEEDPDPIGDDRHSPIAGIVHRYRDRVLLKLTHVCPVYCRFCFRREMVGPGKGTMLEGKALDAALGYIAAHPEIWEVVLTGGDPFVPAPRRLAEVTAKLDKIPHVQILRWHTRVPVADPDAVTNDLVRALTRTGKAVYVVLHVNHPRELTQDVRAAIARLANAGIPLLSQSVLLRGVNDDIETLEALMRALVAARVKPYYLHHADLVPGTAHFRTTIAKGRALMRALHARVSGLCQPTYVLDIPGGHAKAKLGPEDVAGVGGSTRLRDAEGRWHDYPFKK